MMIKSVKMHRTDKRKVFIYGLFFILISIPLLVRAINGTFDFYDGLILGFYAGTPDFSVVRVN
ncbi:Uncharacterised protein [Yersinia aldovae]|nr:Uncharacterised protein [Yersinia aldovae]